jgi:hypothetical protein
VRLTRIACREALGHFEKTRHFQVRYSLGKYATNGVQTINLDYRHAFQACSSSVVKLSRIFLSHSLSIRIPYSIIIYRRYIVTIL